jgi:WD repeat-containing protein 35
VQDVWDLCWATDNPELLAVMEKGRLVVLRGSDGEEPVTSSAWLAVFSDLQVGDKLGAAQGFKPHCRTPEQALHPMQQTAAAASWWQWHHRMD